MKDWEACYRTGEIPWDKGGAAPPLLEVTELHGRALWGNGPVLVPGCGLGHDVRVLASLGIPAIGLDISETAVKKAGSLPKSGSEIYEAGDFLDPSWCAGRSFKGIWEHTCFCAIDPLLRGAYARSAASVLAPGGLLVGVFYLTPHGRGEDESGPPFKVSIAELDELFSPWFERIEGWVPQRAYPGREGREWIGIFRKLPHDRVAGETSSR